MIDTGQVAYFAGRVACADAKPRSANPYPASEHAHGEWLKGWRDEYSTLPAALQRTRDAKETA